MKKTPATHKHDFECFKKVVDAQDKFRNQDISEVIPELSRYFLKKSEGERFSEQYSKTFCAYPWTHLMTNPKGMTFLCCRSEGATSEELSPTGEMGSLKKAFNSKRMKEIRKKMLAGEKVSDCERCYTEEAKGVRSLRMDANTQWLSKENRAQVREIIGKSITEDLHVDSPPLSLDWRPGNSCNLKCRMCGPENSSGIQKEWLELKEERPEFIKHLERYRPIPIGKISSWYENDNVWKELDSWLPSFKKIYITGGEPTLIEGNWSLLNKAAELGYAKDIELQISLNTTRLPAKLSRTLEHFKHTSLNLSIDGMGPTLEYIRFPSTWQKTKENLLEVMDWRLNNLDTWLTPVVQVYNVLTLPDFIEWFLDIKVKTNSPTNICLLPNEGQPLLDISILPQVTRNHAIARWNKLAKHPGFYTCGPILRERVDLILHILETSFQNTAQEKLKDFWHFTKILDAKRGQSFEKTFPDLYEQLRPEIFRDSTKPSLETQAHL